jgi:hypothetical protein
MKRFLAAIGLATTAVWVALPPLGAGQAQQMNSKQESFPIPVAQTGQNLAPPAYLPLLPGVQQMPPPPQAAAVFQSAVSPAVSTAKTSILSELENLDLDQPDPNQDIAVRPECGPWMICVHTYTGPDAPKEARAMVMELRNNPQYRLYAYVFTKGIEERKAELKRIAKAKEDVYKQLASIPNLPPDTQISVPKISIPIIHSNLELQCAVLVGGYKDPDSAKQALNDLRKLDAPDPKKVKLDTQFVVDVDKNGQAERKDRFLNPFAFAYPGPNPCIHAKPGNVSNAEELALLKKLNADEPNSLFKCPKKFTLVVKTFDVPSSIQLASGNKSVMDTKTKLPEGFDAASLKAQSVAVMLRKEKIEAYVLHTKYMSIVSVGGYDAPDDPRLVRDQERLPQFMNKALEKTLGQKTAESIKLLPRPAIMSVPN